MTMDINCKFFAIDKYGRIRVKCDVKSQDKVDRVIAQYDDASERFCRPNRDPALCLNCKKLDLVFDRSVHELMPGTPMKLRVKIRKFSMKERYGVVLYIIAADFN